ncbi:MAG TPA: adenylosuccinate lyase [Anaerolineae bacterium]|nr:adenylosuccinate lyase [Anaerolineae bacterium]HOQ99609.1 adenylosuccinate lyase [Anaerolineae bacterium]HPL28097.1 adenylosuccinate lyase [Anaerolineae bacterium]
MSSYDYETYLSPFTWRYGSAAMRALWSEAGKRRLWRRIWLALAQAEEAAGLVSAAQVADLAAHVDQVDLARAHAIEAEIGHDLMAEVRTYAEQSPVGGGIIHLGATSMDIEDNAEALRLREALRLIRQGVRELLAALAERIAATCDLPALGYTHLQPAEPTTVGYRLCQYAQDLRLDLENLDRALAAVRGKGIKGAVGTSASYRQLLAASAMTPAQLEARVMQELDLPAWPVATQTYPRKADWLALSALAGVAGSLHRFALDLRLLQAPPFGEWSEPFGQRQVGSSAMPFKRNPVTAEKVCSLARFVAALPAVAWENAALSALERTLDDSANRRAVLPEAFLATDEIVRASTRLVRGLQLHEAPMARNLDAYGPFAATEALLMELARAGGDRQAWHERLREHAQAAWAEVQAGRANPLVERLLADPALTALVPAQRVRQLLDVRRYLGDAPERCRAFVAELEEVLTLSPCSPARSDTPRRAR